MMDIPVKYKNILNCTEVMDIYTQYGGCYLSSLCPSVVDITSAEKTVDWITDCHECVRQDHCEAMGYKISQRSQTLVAVCLAFVGLFIWTNKKFK